MRPEPKAAISHVSPFHSVSFISTAGRDTMVVYVGLREKSCACVLHSSLTLCGLAPRPGRSRKAGLTR
jgi:hypothetical protein